MKEVIITKQGVPGKNYNVYQNTCSSGKCFSLGIPKEKLDDFMETYLSNVKKNYAYSHYLTATNIDFVIGKMSFILDSVFNKYIAKIKEGAYNKNFPEYAESLERSFPFIKENLIGIYKNTIHMKSYWGYHGPSNIRGHGNNPYTKKDILHDIRNEVSRIYAENQERIIFDAHDINIVDEVANIFPNFSEDKEKDEKIQTKIPSKLIDKSKEPLMDQLVNTIYDDLVNGDLSNMLEGIDAICDRRDPQMPSSERKEQFLMYFTRVQSSIAEYIYDTYFKNSYSFGIDSYLYENQYFMDMFDVRFVGGVSKKTGTITAVDNLASIDVIKDMLMDGLRDDKYYDHCVMKITYTFDDTNGEEFELEHIKENLYLINDGTGERYVELSNEEIADIKKIGSKSLKKIRRGLTIALYSKKEGAIREYKRLFKEKLRNNGSYVELAKTSSDIFKNNNYLFNTNPLYSSTNVTMSMNIKKFFEIMPSRVKNDDFGLYLGVDYQSLSPIIKDPYKETEGKNMVVVGKTGSGKTFFSMQMIASNNRDRFFVIDPTGSFSKLQNICENNELFVSRVEDLDYNPIALDKDYYASFGVDFARPREDKVSLLLSFLGVGTLDLTEDFVSYLRILLTDIYNNHDNITIDLIQDIITKAIEDKKNPPFSTSPDSHLDETLVMQLRMINRGIHNLSTKGMIYNMLKKKRDLATLFNQHTKIVIDLSSLGIQDKTKLNKADEVLYIYILENIMTYLNFNTSFVNKNIKSIGTNHPATYLFIDEAHLLFNNNILGKRYERVLRTTRNKKSQITGMTQNVEDFLYTKDLGVLNQHSIYMFFKASDIDAYIDIIARGEEGEDNNAVQKKEGIIKKMRFYRDEFVKLKESGVKFCTLVRYFDDVYVTYSQVSNMFLENSDVLTSGKNE